jgi:hypothetical protein
MESSFAKWDLLHSSPSMFPQRQLTKSDQVTGYVFEGRVKEYRVAV